MKMSCSHKRVHPVWYEAVCVHLLTERQQRQQGFFGGPGCELRQRLDQFVHHHSKIALQMLPPLLHKLGILQKKKHKQKGFFFFMCNSVKTTNKTEDVLSLLSWLNIVLQSSAFLFNLQYLSDVLLQGGHLPCHSLWSLSLAVQTLLPVASGQTVSGVTQLITMSDTYWCGAALLQGRKVCPINTHCSRAQSCIKCVQDDWRWNDGCCCKSC